MTKKLLFNILRVIISIGLILFLFWLMRGNIDSVVSTIKRTNKLVFFISFLCVVSGMLLLGLRLWTIMMAQHLNVTLKEAIYLTFIGQFFSNFLPTANGGDIVKAYYASKKTGKKIHSVACILMDRLLGTFTLILMVFVVSFFVKVTRVNKPLTTFLLVALLASFAIFTVLFSRRVAKKVPFLGFISRVFNAEGKMKGLYDIIYNYKKHPKLLLNAMGISFLLQAIMFFAVYLITKSLKFSISLGLVFLLMPIISTAAMAPSINGLGVREGSFVIFFGPFIGKEGAFALSLLWLGLNFSVSLIGGVLYLFNRHLEINKIAKEKEV